MRINLINARQDNELTQINLARKVNISERQYQRLESGDSNGSLKLWQKLSNILEKPIDYLCK